MAPATTPATTGSGHTNANANASTPLDASPSSQLQSHIAVEMSNLDANKGTSSTGDSQNTSGLLNDVAIPLTTPMSSTFAASNIVSVTGTENERPEMSSNATISADHALEPNSAAASSSLTTEPSTNNPPAIKRLDSVAIGPAVEAVVPAVTISEAGPVLVITLLLTSGARHPYKIDERYLTKRNVTVPGVTDSGRKDPLSISVYTLKELILREWREEWEAQPSSPSSIRLIFFGRLLDDKTPLKECRFNTESANVVHMTVRPQDIVDEEDASKGKAMTRDRDGGETTAGCHCVIL